MTLQEKCRILLDAYDKKLLGDCTMPEESNPMMFENQEERLAYFTLPMALNYQRDSYKLWEASLKTYEDATTKDVFDLDAVSKMPIEDLRKKLIKYKLAIQSNKHTATWQTLALAMRKNWGSIIEMLAAVDNDFLKLKTLIREKHKKEFPYLSGPKIFNYWSFIIQQYGGAKLKNSEYIDIAPDTHITKCSVFLGVITQAEAEKLSKDEISLRWLNVLKDSGINPIQMHSPLWFWSRNNFAYKLPN